MLVVFFCLCVCVTNCLKKLHNHSSGASFTEKDEDRIVTNTVRNEMLLDNEIN